MKRTIVESVEYEVYSRYCECGSRSCHHEFLVQSGFDTRQDAIRWMGAQPEGTHTRDKRMWVIREKVTREDNRGCDPRGRVPAEVLAAEAAYVMGASWWGARVWRSARAAWRCARIARRA